MRYGLIATAFTVSMLSSVEALAAPVEADLQTGRRWAETKTGDETDGVQMNEAIFAARYKILDTGLAVGPAFTYSKFRSGDLGDDTTASNYEIGLEAKYAHPITDKLVPFGKMRYVGYSKGTMKFDADDFGAKEDFRTYGVHLGVGAGYAVTENVQLTAEAAYGVQMIRMTGGKVTKAVDENGDALALAGDEAKLPGSPREDFNSKALLLGVNVNL